jgi:hypothetical protein
LLYAAGDNDLSPLWWRVINELEQVGSSDEVNLIAFGDFSGETNAYLFELRKDDDPVEIRSPAWRISNGQEIDSGSAATLEWAASWAFERYPADKYGLIVAGHGGGSPRVIAPDDSVGSVISVPQLHSAIRRVQQRLGQKLEFFGANACLMQTLETAYELRDATKVIVASELVQVYRAPVDGSIAGIDSGWPYDKMARFLVDNPSVSGTNLARQVVRDYGQDTAWSDETSLSAIDPGKIAVVGQQVTQLSLALDRYLRVDPTRVDQVMTALNSTYYYGYQTALGADREHIDLGDFQHRLANAGVQDHDLLYEMADLILAIDKMTLERVVSAAAFKAGARGVSIFYPRDGYVYGKLATYTATYSFAKQYDWDGFLRNFYQHYCNVHPTACS